MLCRRVRKGDRITIDGPATVHVLSASGKVNLGVRADKHVNVQFDHVGGFNSPDDTPEEDRRKHAGH